jgi:hypothetical protein
MAFTHKKGYEKVYLIKKDRLAVHAVFQNLGYLNIDKIGLCV